MKGALGLALGFFLGLMGAMASADAKCIDPFATLPVPARTAFTQTRHFQNVAKPLVAEGVVEIAAAHVRWHVTKPVDILTVIAPEGVTQSVDHGPPQALGASGGDAFLSGSGLLHVLSGNFSAARAQYKITTLPPIGGNWHLRLVPRGEQVARLIRHMDVQGCIGVASLQVQQADGDWMDIRLALPAKSK